MTILQYPQESVYTFAITTGLITTIAAGTPTAGHLAAIRWAGTTSDVIVHRVKADWYAATAFGAAQSVGLQLIPLRSYTLGHSGLGITRAIGANDMKLWTKQTALADFALMCSTTAEMTAGTHTLDAHMHAEAYSATSSTTPTLSLTKDYTADGMPGHRLAANEGLLLRNAILMGATGTARVTFEVTFSLMSL